MDNRIDTTKIGYTELVKGFFENRPVKYVEDIFHCCTKTALGKLTEVSLIKLTKFIVIVSKSETGTEQKKTPDKPNIILAA